MSTKDNDEGVLDVMDVVDEKSVAVPIPTSEPSAQAEPELISAPVPEVQAEETTVSIPESADAKPNNAETDKEISESELRQEQNAELVDVIYDAHKKAFTKHEGKGYLILRDSKNRILDINSGKLQELTGDGYQKYTYIFSKKGISMVLFDERLYDKEYSSNLDAILDADFSENKDDKYVKVVSADQQRYFEASVRNCKNIAELDKDGIKGIVEYVENENPAPLDPEEIKDETGQLKAFFEAK